MLEILLHILGRMLLIPWQRKLISDFNSLSEELLTVEPFSWCIFWIRWRNNDLMWIDGLLCVVHRIIWCRNQLTSFLWLIPIRQGRSKWEERWIRKGEALSSWFFWCMIIEIFLTLLSWVSMLKWNRESFRMFRDQILLFSWCQT